MKIPSYVARECFYKVTVKPEQVKTSSGMLHKAKCPICNDKKKRMYLKEYTKLYLVYCHNCGYSHTLDSFLKQNFPHVYADIRVHVVQAIKDGTYFSDHEDTGLINAKPDYVIDRAIRRYLPQFSFAITSKQDDSLHESYRQKCIRYLKDRRIPEYISNEFVCFFKGPMTGYVGIPFYDEKKRYLLHIQGRKVLNSPQNDALPKYLFIKDLEHDIEFDKQIWGQWRKFNDTPVVICEGTLDACAFENGVSTCGATISETFILKIRDKYKSRIWCVDNYWSDVSGRDLTNRLLEMGEDCFIIPKDMLDIKDANDIIKYIFTDTQFIPHDFVQSNIYSGKLGLSKLKLQL
jgi:transcription elongation factor Elf1